MITELIILAAGIYAGKNVKVSVSEDSQRIAHRLLQTGLAQLPTVKDWAVGQIASARSRPSALSSEPFEVTEVSDETMKKFEEEFIASMTKSSSSDHLAEVSAGFEKELAERFDASQTSVLGSK